MGKVKKKLVALGVAFTLALGVGVIGDLATSHNTSKAEAYTDTYWKYVYNCMPYPSGAFQWRDYNWWEEMWGAHDEYVWKYNFYYYC